MTKLNCLPPLKQLSACGFFAYAPGAWPQACHSRRSPTAPPPRSAGALAAPFRPSENARSAVWQVSVARQPQPTAPTRRKMTGA